MKKQADIDMDGENIISPQQFKAIHQYFKMVAELLNDAGLDMRTVLKPEVEIPWDTKTVKDYLWRPIQKLVAHEESSRDILQSDVDKIFNTMNRHLAKFGIHQPFPSVEELVKEMQKEDARLIALGKKK